MTADRRLAQNLLIIGFTAGFLVNVAIVIVAVKMGIATCK